MTVVAFRKLRTWTKRQRDRVDRQIRLEPNNELNLYRKRLVGQTEAYGRVLNRMDAFIRFHHDRWHDRRKRRA